MKDNRLSITVGIPAYNEQSNIKKLLLNLLSQENKNYILHKIILVLDGCTDDTAKIASSIHNRHLQIISNRKKMGQGLSQNKIFSLADSEVVVLLEADTCPSQSDYLDRLLEPIIKNRSLGYVQGTPKPIAAKSATAAILNSQVQAFHKIASKTTNQIDFFCSGQGGRAFIKKIYLRLRWPNDVPEDVFGLLWCKANSFSCFFNKDAECNFHSSETIEQFLKARHKIYQGKDNLHKYFSSKLIDGVYRRPTLFMAKALIIFMIFDPKGFLIYSLFKIRLSFYLFGKFFTSNFPVKRSLRFN